MGHDDKTRLEVGASHVFKNGTKLRNDGPAPIYVWLDADGFPRAQSIRGFPSSDVTLFNLKNPELI